MFGFPEFAQRAASHLIVRSALNPVLWLCAIVAIPCFAFAAYVQNDRPLMWAFVILGALPVLVACGLAIGFGIYKPSKLQSEDYQIRERGLDMLQLQQQTSGSIIDVSPYVVAIANPVPQTAALPPSSGESK